MKKIIIFSVIGLAFIAVLIWFGKMNSKSPIQFETEKPFKTNIIKKTVKIKLFCKALYIAYPSFMNPV